jgi:DNA-directed RNA polymerase subunit N (RpoN/RPB10)
VIDIEAHNREVQDKWDSWADEMNDGLSAEEFFSYLDMDDVMSIFMSALQDSHERGLKQTLIQYAEHVYESWDQDVRKKKDAYIDSMLDQHGVDKYGSDRAGHLAWHKARAA